MIDTEPIEFFCLVVFFVCVAAIIIVILIEKIIDLVEAWKEPRR